MAVILSDQLTISASADGLGPQGQGANIQHLIATLTTPTIVADNEVIQLLELPVDALLISVKVAVADLGTTGDLNLGFYPGAGSGVTIATSADELDEDALKVAIDVNDGATALTEFRFAAKATSTATQKVWELAGLSARPKYATIILALTASEATTAAGTIEALVQIART